MPVVSLASDNLLDDLDVVVALLEDANRATPENGTLIVANQLDAAGAVERLDILKEFYGDTFRICEISAETGDGKDVLFQEIYTALGILRVYPKAPGKPIEHDQPIVLPTGATVLDAAPQSTQRFCRISVRTDMGPRMARWTIRKS